MKNRTVSGSMLLFLVASATAATAGEAARFDFDRAGQPEGWEAFASSRLVADGVLRGVAKSSDPQLGHDGVERAADAVWDTLTVKVRERDHAGAAVPHNDTGVVLIFNVQPGVPGTNFGVPRTVSDPDADGFRTMAWDLSSFAPANTGRVRLDPIGGPETVRPGSPNNAFEIDSIVFYDTSGP